MNFRAGSGVAKAAAVVWAMCFALTYAVYGRAAAYPFLLDDIYHFETSALVRSWQGLADVWRTGYFETVPEGGLYRPLLRFVWVIEIAGLGGSKGVVLFISAVFHALNGALLFAIARRMGLSAILSAAAGAWFTLHAAHSEVILEGVGQGEIFSLGLGLGALLCVLSARECDRRWPVFLAAVLMGANFFVKEHAFAWLLPFGFAVWAFAPGGAKTKWAGLSLTGGLFVAAVAARYAVFGAFGPENEYQLAGHQPLWARVSFTLYVSGRYFLLAAFPANINPDYTWLLAELPIRFSNPMVWVGVAVFLGFGAAALASAARRRWDWLLVLLMCVAPLSLFVGFRPIGTVFAERHAYLALAGAALLLAMSLECVVTHVAARHPASTSHGAQVRKLAAGAMAIYALAMGWRASAQTVNYESGEQLWQSAWDANPNNFFAASSLAYHQLQSVKIVEARESAEAALRLNPNFAHAHLVLGEICFIHGKIDEAVAHFEVAMSHPNMRANALEGMINAYLKGDRPEEARATLARFEQLRPGNARVARMRGMISAYEAQNRGGNQ